MTRCIPIFLETLLKASWHISIVVLRNDTCVMVQFHDLKQILRTRVRKKGETILERRFVNNNRIEAWKRSRKCQNYVHNNLSFNLAFCYPNFKLFYIQSLFTDYPRCAHISLKRNCRTVSSHIACSTPDPDPIILMLSNNLSSTKHASTISTQ